MSNAVNLSEQLEKVMHWKTTSYRGVTINWTSNGYEAFGIVSDSLKKVHSVIDESYKILGLSIKK